MKFFNRVLVNTATTGQGTITLGAVVSANYMTAVEGGVSDGDVVAYVIEEGADFEVGTGVIGGSGTTLTRATVYNSKIAGTAGTSKMELAGTATVFLDSVAAFFNDLEARSGFLQKLPEVIKTDNYTLASTDAGTMLAFNKVSAITGTLPAVASLTDEAYFLRCIGAGTLTIDGNASELLEGETSFDLITGWAAMIWPNEGKTAWRVATFPSFNALRFAAVAEDFIPDGDNTRDFGSPLKRLAKAHIADARLETINGGAQSGFKNRLHNPLFLVDDHGNAAGVTVAGDHIVGGHRFTHSTDGAFTSARSSADAESVPYALKATVTTADASLAAAQYAFFITAIEGYDFADAMFGTAGAKSFTFAARVRSAVTGIHSIGFQNGASNRSYVHEVNIAAADTWQDVEFTVPGDTSGTWDIANGIGLLLSPLVAAVGSNFQTSTLDQWQAGSFWGSTNQVNAIATVNNVIAFENPRLSIGDKAIPTEWRPIPVETLHRKRFFQKAVSLVQSIEYSAGAVTGYKSWLRPQEMRIAPSNTITVTSSSNSNSHAISSSSETTVTASMVLTAGGGGFGVYTIKSYGELV